MASFRAALVFGFAYAIALTGVAPAQETTRVSVDSSGNQTGGGWAPKISGDGGTVGFQSDASDLVPGDTNGVYDVFVHDMSTGVTERVSVDSSGNQGNGISTDPALSEDGTIVVFSSIATNLVAGDTNTVQDIFVHDRTTGVTERVNVDSLGHQANNTSDHPTISRDGRYVAFMSSATNLVGHDSNLALDIFVHDRSTGITRRVSVDSSGTESNGDSRKAWISGDGQFVAFDSDADNLVPSDTNRKKDAFVHDLSTGTTERVSVSSAGAQGNNWSGNPAITPGGQFVVFVSWASNLVAGDTNHRYDVFVRDRTAGTTEVASVNSSGIIGNDSSGTGDYNQYPSISDDGRIVVFDSFATNLAPNPHQFVGSSFLRDRAQGITDLLSVDPMGGGGSDLSLSPYVSGDGQVEVFWSKAANLVPNDTNMANDVFVRTRQLASWTNYGAGFPGTNGVPAFTPRSDPLLGTTVTLDLQNSYGLPTMGLLFIGTQRASIHSGWGGELLVQPIFLIPVALTSGSNSYADTLPDDNSLCGVVNDVQAAEADPGAAHGVSITAGLELVFGR